VDTAVTAGIEQRRAPRLGGTDPHGVVRVRVRPGHEAVLVDISDGGAAIETAYRLLPGTSVELQLDTGCGRTSARGLVLRCAVVTVHATRVTYGGAICFDTPIRWLPGGSAEYVVPVGRGEACTSYPSIEDIETPVSPSLQADSSSTIQPGVASGLMSWGDSMSRSPR
jgi:hypothetical protein